MPDDTGKLKKGNFMQALDSIRAEAERLMARRDLPPEVEATLRKHEADGTTDSADYANACLVFYQRHLCRLDPWPDGVTYGMAKIDQDPTVYHTMNGPSEFHVIGSIKDWSSTARRNISTVSGRWPPWWTSTRRDRSTTHGSPRRSSTHWAWVRSTATPPPRQEARIQFGNTINS